MRILVYDLEILKAIPQGEPLPGIKYCAGWDDHVNMGISVIGAMVWEERPFRASGMQFFSDDHIEFQSLANTCDLIVGFNSESFDDRVCAANGIRIKTDYDILREVYKAKGWDPYPEVFDDKYKGYGLDVICQSTLHAEKTGNGASAPIWWQLGQKEKVVNYCLNDVKLTAQLFERITNNKPLIDPNTGQALYLGNPLL